MSDFFIAGLSSCITYFGDTIKIRQQTTKNIKGNYFNGITYHITAYSIFWGTNFLIRDSLSKHNTSFKHNIIISYISSCIASTITNPIWIIKKKIQTNTSIFPLYIQNGLLTVYLSNLKLGLQLPLYDFLRKKQYNPIMASISSKLISSALFYPFDTIRSNIHISNQKETISYFYRTIKELIKHKKIYYGFFTYNLTTGTQFTIMMLLKECFSKSQTIK